MGQGIVVAQVGDIEDGTGIAIAKEHLGTVEDVAVFNDGGEYSALDNMCSHEQTGIAEGWVEDGCVECPMHASRFRLSDGAVLSPPAPTGIAAHAVHVEGTDIVLVPNPERLA